MTEDTRLRKKRGAKHGMYSAETIHTGVESRVYMVNEEEESKA